MTASTSCPQKNMLTTASYTSSRYRKLYPQGIVSRTAGATFKGEKTPPFIAVIHSYRPTLTLRVSAEDDRLSDPLRRKGQPGPPALVCNSDGDTVAS